MADKRELILVRLKGILEDVKTELSVVTVARNRGLLKNEKRPALVVLDGDERFRLTNDRHRGRAGMMAPSIQIMNPEIYILLDEARPITDETGTKLNQMRIVLVHAIATDSALATLVGSNGNVVYNGCVTDLKSGGALSGEMKLDFAIQYVFDPL
jgi:hypothetical protein